MTADQTTKEAFPTQKLTALEHGKTPDFKLCRIWMRELSQNAIAIETNLGGGEHGHLGLIMVDTEYLALMQNNFTLPEKPQDQPDYTGLTSAATRQDANDTWKRKTKEYETTRSVERALKQQILEACPATFINKLNH